MQRSLALAALVALAISVLVLVVGIGDTAPSSRAQGDTATATATATATSAATSAATATPAATAASVATTTATSTSRLTCTDETLGGTGALAANPKLATDCNTLLALRYNLSRPDTLNWSPTVAITSATRGWDGVTVGTDADGNKRVTGLSLAPYAFTLADLAPLDGIVTVRLDTYTTPETPATTTTPRTPRTARTARTPATTRTALPANPRTCITTTLGGSRTVNAVLARDCDTLLAIKSTLEGTLPAGTAPLNWSPALALASWDGVTVSTSGTKRVATLSLSRKGLNGSIPTQIGSLTGLTSLNLSGNRLTGNIPHADRAPDRAHGTRPQR